MSTHNLEHKAIRWEHHVGTVFQVIITTLLLWTGSSVVDLLKNVATLNAQSSYTQALLARMTEQLDATAKTGEELGNVRAEMRQNKIQTDADLKRIEARVGVVERKVEKDEQSFWRRK